MKTAADLRRPKGMPFIPENLTVKQIRGRLTEIGTAEAALRLIDAELRGKNRDLAVRYIKQRYDRLLEEQETS